MNFKDIKKPKTQKEQVDLIWDFLFNHLNHKVKFLDTKITFILSLLAILMVLIAIALARG